MLNVYQIQQIVQSMAQRIEAPEHYLPSFFTTEQSGRPHIEITSDGYHLVVCERGEENSRQSTTNFRQLLYWIFRNITFEMACRWECEHRKEFEDFRRQLFAHQIGLMNIIDPEFAQRLKIEKETILKNMPFSDNAPNIGLT